MKTINNFAALITVLVIVAALTACSAISPYIDKATEMSVETSTKTLEATFYYQCDRARVGDLIRRYPDIGELTNHINWCLSQTKKDKYIAPRPAND